MFALTQGPRWGQRVMARMGRYGVWALTTPVQIRKHLTKFQKQFNTMRYVICQWDYPTIQSYVKCQRLACKD
jgi:hypothetical protein